MEKNILEPKRAHYAELKSWLNRVGGFAYSLEPLTENRSIMMGLLPSGVLIIAEFDYEGYTSYIRTQTPDPADFNY